MYRYAIFAVWGRLTTVDDIADNQSFNVLLFRLEYSPGGDRTLGILNTCVPKGMRFRMAGCFSYKCFT